MAHKVTFFLSFPRSRTAWLSVYLTGMGVYCFHELWRTCRSMEEFRQRIDEKRRVGPVANADATNWLFIKEIREAYPDATFIELQRPWPIVRQSLERHYGEGDYEYFHRASMKANELSLIVPSAKINVGRWEAKDSLDILKLAGGTMDERNRDWHDRIHQVNIQVSQQRIIEDHGRVASGKAANISEKIMELCGGLSWV